MPIKNPRLSLPLLLVFPSLVSTFVTVALASHYCFHNSQKAMKSLIWNWQQVEAAQISDEIEKSLAIPPAIAQDRAKDFREGRLNATETRDLIERFQHQRSLFESMEKAAIYLGTTTGTLMGLGYKTANPEAIVLSNEGGNIQVYPSVATAESASVGRAQPSEDPRLQSWYRRALTAKKPVWGESEYDAIAQQRKLVLSQSLYNPSGQLEGVLAIDYSLSELDRILQDLKIGASREIFIVDRVGQTVATSVTPSRATPEPLPLPLVQYLQQQGGTLETIRDRQQFPLQLDGQQHWIGLFPFNDDSSPRWWIVIVTPEAEFLSPLYASSRDRILLAFAISVSAAAISWMVSRQIARPLRRLQEATAQIANGDWQQRIELNRNDELGDLAHSFNGMAEQLQQAFAQLQALNQTVLDSESRLLQFLEVLPIGLSVHDLTGKPVYLNQVARDLCRVDPAEMQTLAQTLEACQIYLAGTPQLYPLERFPIARALQGERVNAEDLELRQGERAIPLEMRSTPIVTPSGEVAYALATFLDISERKRAEEILLHYNRSLEQRVEARTAALVKAEAELKGLFAAMQEVVLAIDKEGRYRRVISKQSELLVRPKHQLLKHTLHEVFEAEQADLFLQTVQEVIATQQTLNLDYCLELEGKTVWFEASVSPFSEDNVVWVARDVSDRQVLEDKVRTSEAKMRAVLEAIPDIILMIDESQNIEVSPTNFSYLCASNINWLNLTIEQFWSEENSNVWFSLVRQVREKKEVVNFDYSLYKTALEPETSPVREVWFSAQIAPLPNNSVIWVARDISERKAAEAAILEAKEAAEAASRTKSTFVANMSHELRSPLNAILGFAQLLARSPDIPPERREYAEIIIRSGEHLLGLIDQVLNLSKIEAGRAQLNEIDFDLERALEDIEELFSLKAEEKGLRFGIERAANLPPYVRCDRLKLRQIAINLLGNSIKFTPNGSVILRVTALEPRTGPSQWIRLEVEDTGPGIEADEFDYLFESFQQTRTGQQLQEGTGVGLSIVREFVSLMGGSITVSSRGYTYNPDAPPAALSASPAATTIFTVTLPMLPIEGVEAEESPRVRRPPLKGATRQIALEPNQPQYRILVADDKEYNRQLLVQLLAPVGFAVREACNGEEAIAIWESWQPHLIWMNMRMPVLDGYEATRYIKSHVGAPATIVIALTASPLEEERTLMRAMGCDDCADKPIQEQAIFDLIARHLGVRYIDEDPMTGERGQANNSSLLILLESMPSAWVRQLERAAALIDDEQIFALLSEIPAELPLLAQSLNDWVRTFRCDKIVELLDRYHSQKPNL